MLPPELLVVTGIMVRQEMEVQLMGDRNNGAHANLDIIHVQRKIPAPSKQS